jgi:hypothetical protein
MSEDNKYITIDKDNGTWVDELVYLVYNLQSSIYLGLSCLIILVMINTYGYSETREMIMFLLGSNAGMVSNTGTERKKLSVTKEKN